MNLTGSEEGRKELEQFEALTAYQKEIQIPKRALLRDPGDMDARYNLALVHLKYERCEQALRECQEMLRKQPASTRLRRLLQELNSLQKAADL